MDYIHQLHQIFILFVDDCTRIMWVYFLKQNSEAFNSFIHFRTLLANQNKSKMNTHHDIEYIYDSLHNYDKEKGIKRKLTKKYSPQSSAEQDCGSEE